MKDKKYYFQIISKGTKKPKTIHRDVSNFSDDIKHGICGQVTTNAEFDELIQRYGVLNIYQKVVEVIKNLHDVDLGDVSFSANKTKLTIGAAVEPVRKKLKAVNIDALLLDEVHAFFVLMFLWNNVISFKEVSCEEHYESGESFDELYDSYFKYLFTLYYALIKDEARCDIYKFHQVLYEYRNIEKGVFNVAVCCQYCALYFLVAHECAHIYFERCQMKFENDEAEEFEADKFALDIIKYILTYDENNSDSIEEERVIYSYTFHSPFILLLFHHMFFCLSAILNKDNSNLELLAQTERRIKNLQKHMDSLEVSFDVKISKSIYDSIDDTVDIFYRMLSDYIKDGRISQTIEFLENC